MDANSRILIIIPARLQASRLPGKPLADIHGDPMIVHVWRRAMESSAGRVFVATDAEPIAEAITRAGGEAIMTRADHTSGSDRVYEAMTRADPHGHADIVVNLQGDLPTIQPDVVRACVAALGDRAADIATLAAPINDPFDVLDPNIVKVVGTRVGPQTLRALYFTRASAPFGPGIFHHHIGIYAFRRAALERFVHLPASELELRERLEQLRALEAGMRIHVGCVDAVPHGVDTPADLERARSVLAAWPGAAHAAPLVAAPGSGRD